MASSGFLATAQLSCYLGHAKTPCDERKKAVLVNGINAVIAVFLGTKKLLQRWVNKLKNIATYCRHDV